MSIDKILVTIIGLVGIVFTYWFFLMKKEKEVKAGKEIEIKVEGGYSPSNIVVPLKKSTKITFFRTDENSCLEEVVLSDFRVRKFLPLNQKASIELVPQKKGEFPFSCGMNMFHGRIIVR